MTPSERDREMAAAFMGMHLTGSGPDQRGGKVVLKETYLVAQGNLALIIMDARAAGFRAGCEAAAKECDGIGGPTATDCAAAIRALAEPKP